MKILRFALSLLIIQSYLSKRRINTRILMREFLELVFANYMLNSHKYYTLFG